MSEEQRKKKRLPVGRPIHVRVIDRASQAPIGRLANIHGEGFMLISSEGQVKDDHLYQLAFEDENNSELFKLGAECLWVNAAVGDQFWAGFQIIDIAEHERPKVESLIRAIESE